KNAATVANAVQGSLNNHLCKLNPTKWVLPYSDKLFREAAIKWLASTNQVCLFLDTTIKEKKMVDIASRATMGVIVPNQKTTRCEIINMFKQQLTKLREQLNVGFVD
ncbi:hypothetical protein BDR05DRAFT_876262, partial [Suillus weaverae]